MLKAALEEARLKYAFAGEKSATAAMTDLSLDLRMVGGQPAEEWSLGESAFLFCTDFPPKFPDPSGHICKLVGDYENDKIDEKGFTQSFFSIIDGDSAIIPISHFGVQLYLTPGVNRDSISPLMCVMRFEDVQLE